MNQQEEKLSLEKVLKRSWPTLLFGALFCVGISLLLFQLAVRGTFRQEQDASITNDQEKPADEVRRLLDGVEVENGQEKNELYSVMIGNTPEAWPLAGPANANLVIEAPVEGGITRFFLVFDSAQEFDTIGPVRSARPYYVDWAESLQTVYAHVGGSPDAISQIRTTENFRDLDEFSNPYRFVRSPKREMPHNTFTSTEELSFFSSLQNWEESTFTPWAYTEATEKGIGSEILIPYGGPWNVKWEYKSDEDLYIRWQGGNLQKDIDGQGVAVKNVVVIQTNAKVLDSVGRLSVRTTGEGSAVIFRNGNRIDGTWSRKDGEWITFVDMNGNTIPFEPGKTWISVVTSESQFPK